jgi:hypothetical protein
VSFTTRPALSWSILYLTGWADPITLPDAVEERKYHADGTRTRSLRSLGIFPNSYSEMRRIHITSHYVIKINFNIISHSSYTTELVYAFGIYVVFHMHLACAFIHSGNNNNIHTDICSNTCRQKCRAKVSMKVAKL